MAIGVKKDTEKAHLVIFSEKLQRETERVKGFLVPKIQLLFETRPDFFGVKQTEDQIRMLPSHKKRI